MATTVETQADHEIVIPDWHPATLNKLMKNNWARARLKKMDRQLIEAYAYRAGVPPAKGPRRVRLTIERKRSRSGRWPDPDAFWKSVLDGLVYAGMLVDDDRHWVVTDPVRYAQGDRMATIIELWDLDGGDGAA